jgi:hypothetical protein
MTAEAREVREFADRDGRRWRVWWSAAAHASVLPPGRRLAIRPAGLCFESAATGDRRFVPHPFFTVAALPKMSPDALQRWLDRAEAAR